MKVLVLTNGELVEKEIENELSVLQKEVGGYIEIPCLSYAFAKNDINTIINEEGKMIEGMRPEIVIIDKSTNQIADVVMGNVIFAKFDGVDDFESLTDEQIALIKRELSGKALTTDGKIVRTLYI